MPDATRDSIFKSKATAKIHTLDVPEWGGTVYVRELTGKQRDELDADWLEWRKEVNGKEDDWSYLYAFICMFCVTDSEGHPIFANCEEDVKAINEVPAKSLQRVARFAMQVNGWGSESEESSRKNYGSGRNDCSGSGSPASGAAQ